MHLITSVIHLPKVLCAAIWLPWWRVRWATGLSPGHEGECLTFSRRESVGNELLHNDLNTPYPQTTRSNRSLTPLSCTHSLYLRLFSDCFVVLLSLRNWQLLVLPPKIWQWSVVRGVLEPSWSAGSHLWKLTAESQVGVCPNTPIIPPHARHIRSSAHLLHGLNPFFCKNILRFQLFFIVSKHSLFHCCFSPPLGHRLSYKTFCFNELCGF